jgi:polyketide biosynthesis enoyl-CoA hydratase PksH
MAVTGIGGRARSGHAERRLRVEELSPGAVCLTMCAPQCRNRLDEPMLACWSQALDAADTSDRMAVVIASEGADFCSGGDLGDPTAAIWQPDLAGAQSLLHRLAGLAPVTVAVVEGAATGGGVGLAAACDIVIAGPRATFRLTEVLFGLIPAAVTPLLAARVGWQRARTLGLTARSIDAAQAAAIGLADAALDDPHAALRQTLRELGRADQGALRALKSYHLQARPADAGHPQLARSMVQACLEEPRVRRRLASMYQAGLLP